MNKLFLLTMLILISSHMYAGELKQSRLTPEISVFSGVTMEVTDYYACLVKIFSKAYERNENSVKIRVVVVPSFSPEYVIGVKQHGEKYVAFKYASEKHIWLEYQTALAENTVGTSLHLLFPIVETEAEIAEETFRILETLWNHMIHDATYQEPCGLDGISYHFSTSRLATAYTWSPDPDSQTGYLVQLTELLGQFTETNEKREIEHQIFDIATQLVKSLNITPNQLIEPDCL